MYPPELVAPMKEDLTSVGFKQLTTAQEVDDVISSTKGSLLIVVNSVCGCAAGNMRPGVKLSLSNDKHPATLTTVFAGVDGDTKIFNFLSQYSTASIIDLNRHQTWSKFDDVSF